MNYKDKQQNYYSFLYNLILINKYLSVQATKFGQIFNDTQYTPNLLVLNCCYSEGVYDNIKQIARSLNVICVDKRLDILDKIAIKFIPKFYNEISKQKDAFNLQDLFLKFQTKFNNKQIEKNKYKTIDRRKYFGENNCNCKCLQYFIDLEDEEIKKDKIFSMFSKEQIQYASQFLIFHDQQNCKLYKCSIKSIQEKSKENINYLRKIKESNIKKIYFYQYFGTAHDQSQINENDDKSFKNQFNGYIRKCFNSLSTNLNLNSQVQKIESDESSLVKNQNFKIKKTIWEVFSLYISRYCHGSRYKFYGPQDNTPMKPFRDGYPFITEGLFYNNIMLNSKKQIQEHIKSFKDSDSKNNIYIYNQSIFKHKQVLAKYIRYKFENLIQNLAYYISLNTIKVNDELNVDNLIQQVKNLLLMFEQLKESQKIFFISQKIIMVNSSKESTEQKELYEQLSQKLQEKNVYLLISIKYELDFKNQNNDSFYDIVENQNFQEENKISLYDIFTNVNLLNQSKILETNKYLFKYIQYQKYDISDILLNQQYNKLILEMQINQIDQKSSDATQNQQEKKQTAEMQTNQTDKKSSDKKYEKQYNAVFSKVKLTKTLLKIIFKKERLVNNGSNIEDKYIYEDDENQNIMDENEAENKRNNNIKDNQNKCNEFFNIFSLKEIINYYYEDKLKQKKLKKEFKLILRELILNSSDLFQYEELILVFLADYSTISHCFSKRSEEKILYHIANQKNQNKQASFNFEKIAQYLLISRQFKSSSFNPNMFDFNFLNLVYSINPEKNDQTFKFRSGLSYQLSINTFTKDINQNDHGDSKRNSINNSLEQLINAMQIKIAYKFYDSKDEDLRHLSIQFFQSYPWQKLFEQKSKDSSDNLILFCSHIQILKTIFSLVLNKISSQSESKITSIPDLKIFIPKMINEIRGFKEKIKNNSEHCRKNKKNWIENFEEIYEYIEANFEDIVEIIQIPKELINSLSCGQIIDIFLSIISKDTKGADKILQKFIKRIVIVQYYFTYSNYERFITTFQTCQQIDNLLYDQKVRAYLQYSTLSTKNLKQNLEDFQEIPKIMIIDEEFQEQKEDGFNRMQKNSRLFEFKQKQLNKINLSKRDLDSIKLIFIFFNSSSYLKLFINDHHIIYLDDNEKIDEKSYGKIYEMSVQFLIEFLKYLANASNLKIIGLAFTFSLNELKEKSSFKKDECYQYFFKNIKFISAKDQKIELGLLQSKSQKLHLYEFKADQTKLILNNIQQQIKSQNLKLSKIKNMDYQIDFELTDDDLKQFWNYFIKHKQLEIQLKIIESQINTNPSENVVYQSFDYQVQLQSSIIEDAARIIIEYEKEKEKIPEIRDYQKDNFKKLQQLSISIKNTQIQQKIKQIDSIIYKKNDPTLTRFYQNLKQKDVSVKNKIYSIIIDAFEKGKDKQQTDEEINEEIFLICYSFQQSFENKNIQKYIDSGLNEDVLFKARDDQIIIFEQEKEKEKIPEIVDNLKEELSNTTKNTQIQQKIKQIDSILQNKNDPTFTRFYQILQQKDTQVKNKIYSEIIDAYEKGKDKQQTDEEINEEIFLICYSYQQSFQGNSEVMQNFQDLEKNNYEQKIKDSNKNDFIPINNSQLKEFINDIQQSNEYQVQKNINKIKNDSFQKTNSNEKIQNDKMFNGEILSEQFAVYDIEDSEDEK